MTRASRAACLSAALAVLLAACSPTSLGPTSSATPTPTVSSPPAISNTASAAVAAVAPTPPPPSASPEPTASALPTVIECELPRPFSDRPLTCDAAVSSVLAYVQARHGPSAVEAVTIKQATCDDSGDCVFAEDQAGLVDVSLRDGGVLQLDVFVAIDGTIAVVPR